MTRSILFFLSLIAGTISLLAQSTPPSPTPTSPIAADLKEISPGIFEYHGVRLDKNNHRVSFPGRVNQREGSIEYLLVNEKGKVHESLFSTKIQPRDIHLALLLIGLKENPQANSADAVPPTAIDMAYLQAAPKLKGPSVKLSVTWTQDGKQKEIAAEDWIYNLQTKHAMSPGLWTYNGSRIEDGVFLADQELSIVAVITDPTALVNNPRDGYDNDQIWQVQDKIVPPLDAPVEITITLAEPDSTKP